MPAFANKEYIEAQLASAVRARKRLEAAATQVFGRKRGAAILKRVAQRATARIKIENPHLFG